MELWQRMCLFLIGCMGARFGLAYLAYKMPLKYLPVLGAFALVVSIGFGLIYINGWRKTGLEVGGQKIWWNALRPVHAGLWFAVAIMSFAKNRNAWMFIFADAVLGLLAFAMHHLQINFNMLR